MSVAIFICRHARLSPFWLTSSRHVAVLVCQRFGVAVLACRCFDCTPISLQLTLIYFFLYSTGTMIDHI